jgi:class 3 adenylate cyclase
MKIYRHLYRFTAVSVFSIGLLLSLCAVSKAQAQSQEDSLLKVLSGLQVDSLKADVLIQLSSASLGSNPEKSENYARRALQHSEPVGYYKGVAGAYRYLGLVQYNQSQYKEAFDSWLRALAMYDSVGDKANMARMYSNLAAIYESQSIDDKALEFGLKSLKLAEQINDTTRIITALTNVGVIYGKKENTFDKALEFDLRAIKYAKQIGDKESQADLEVNIGEIKLKQGKLDSALVEFENAHSVLKGTERAPYILLNIGNVYALKGNYFSAESYQRKALQQATDLDLKRDMATALMALANTAMKQGKNKEAADDFEKAKAILIEIGVLEELRDVYDGLAKTYFIQKDYIKAYQYQDLLIEVNDSIYNVKTSQKNTSQVFEYQLEKKQSEVALLNTEKKLADEMAQRQRNQRIGFQIGLGLVIIILFILFRNYLNKVKINKLLDSQKAKIESLLLNILPASVAKELEKNGQAAPRFYDSVSVLFTDFKDFTKIADTMTPREIVDELNDFFTAFDDITETHGLEKIKTIGDAYMCAGGIPVENDVHPVQIIRAAIDIVDYMAQKNVIRKAEGKNPWNLRVGIHTGPIAAGVVGRKKYAYDIWGSTVNIASRMESNGEPGRINISSATYELVKDRFHCSYRGKISAKNIGEIDMYFVDKEIDNTVEEPALMASK